MLLKHHIIMKDLDFLTKIKKLLKKQSSQVMRIIVIGQEKKKLKTKSQKRKILKNVRSQTKVNLYQNPE